ncbi:MAG: hypothetical protein G3H99_00355 [Ferrovum sp.]|nr:hypothetical protein [Ferrovum sp.]NDU88161.1 hypothetical protein [Ferrovum sp.]
MTEPSPTAPSHRFRGFGTLFLILVAVILLGVTIYLRSQLLDLRRDLSKRLAESDQLTHQTQTLAQQANEANRETNTHLAILESRFGETQNQQVELEALYQDLMRHRDDWVLAEVEQLVMIANQQLELTGNVQSALAALEAADLRMQHLEQPALAHLRQTLKEDIDRLRALPFVDTNGISLRLDSLIREVDTLPLSSEARPPASSPTTTQQNSVAQRLGHEILEELSNAIRIRRMDVPELPLLTPEQSFFLKENLKLRFMAVRVDALARNESRYKDDLEMAQEWLTRYFDITAPAVKSMLSAVRQLKNTPVSTPLPDVSDTLAAVHAARGLRP